MAGVLALVQRIRHDHFSTTTHGFDNLAKVLKRRAHELLWKLEGRGVRPTNFPVVDTLAAVHAYLVLLEKVAADDLKTRLRFTGLRIIRGSATFAAQANDVDLTEHAAKRSSDLISGRQPPPRNVAPLVHGVQQEMSRIPDAYTARVIVGNFTTELTRQTLTPANDMSLVEYTTMRVRVLQVGGTSPKVAVESDTDGRFTLDLSTEDDARRIAVSLYQQIDISASIVRGGNNKVKGGTLFGFTPVTAMDGGREIEEWRRWFAEAGAGWRDVDDVDAELHLLRGDHGGWEIDDPEEEQQLSRGE